MTCFDCQYWDEATQECTNKDSNYYMSEKRGEDGCSL